VEETAAGDGEEFEGIVQAGGVAAAGLDDGVEQREIGGGQGRVGKIGFAGMHPVAVPPEGVDLPIMRHHAEGVGQGPSGEGVGAIPLVENGEGGLVGWILQIEVETLELGAGEHALVDDDPGAEGGDIEGGRAIGMATVFDLVEAKEKSQFKGVVREFFGVRPSYEELFDEGGGKGGFFSEDAVVDGNRPPAQGNQTAFRDDFLGDFADVGLGVGVLGREKKESNAQVAFLIKTMPEFFDLSFEKFEGDLSQDAGSVPRLGVRIQSAAVGELANATESPFQNRAGAFSMNVGDKSDAARIVFVVRAVKALGTGKIVIQTESCHGNFTILKETLGARVGILLRDKRFRGIVPNGTSSPP